MDKKISLGDIIGIVQTKEKTNSVELKKEAYMDSIYGKRFEFHKDDGETGYGVLIDNHNQEFTLEGINEESFEYFEFLTEYLNNQEEKINTFKNNEKKVMELIDKKIEYSKKNFEQSYDSWYQGMFDILTELRKKVEEIFND